MLNMFTFYSVQVEPAGRVHRLPLRDWHRTRGDEGTGDILIISYHQLRSQNFRNKNKRSRPSVSLID